MQNIMNHLKNKVFTKSNYFKLFLLTGPKWPLSTWKASFMHLRQGTSLLSTPWPLRIVLNCNFVIDTLYCNMFSQTLEASLHIL